MIHALRYAADGFAVFPVYEPTSPGVCSCGKDNCRGKHPRTIRGVLDASVNYEQIKEWWTKWPNASIGIATGKISGVSVVDLDGPTGISSGRTLKLSSNVTALTGNGKQLFYADIEGKLSNSVKKLADGVDTRGTGGYVVVPPSLHPNGKRYGWEGQSLKRSALVPLPAILMEPTATLISGSTVSRRSDGWVAEALKGMKNGNIDETLFKICARLRADGYSESDASALLGPHADKAGASPGHLLDKIKNVWSRYIPNSMYVSSQAKSEAIDAFLDNKQEVSWLCKPIIAEKSIGFIAGLPETCKTWLAMDLAVESARSCGTWLGLFPCATRRVLFIDQERFKGETQRRFDALIVGKGLSRGELKQNLFIRCGTTTKLDVENSFQAFRMDLLELKPDLVLIDSFATFHNSPENDRMAIQNVLNRIKALRDEVGCSFIFINHESKMVFQHVEDSKAPTAFDMLGSVGIVAAAEFCLTVRKIEPGTSMVHHTKSTLASASKSFTVALTDTDKGVILRGNI